jgi:hypothetical protein
MDSDKVARIPGSYQTFEEAVWTRRGTWGAVVIGGIVGLAITLILGTVGAAAGIVGGAVAADEAKKDRSRESSRGTNGTQDHTRVEATSRPQDDNRTRQSGMTEKEEKAAKGAAAGAGVWLIITAMMAGLLGGWVAGRVAQVFESDVKLLAVLTWSVGVVMLYVLAMVGTSGLASGLGAAAGNMSNGPGVDTESGRNAALVTGGALWALVIGHVVGLLGTLLGTRIGMKRRIKLYPSGLVHDRQEGREYPRPPGTYVAPSTP